MANIKVRLQTQNGLFVGVDSNRSLYLVDGSDNAEVFNAISDRPPTPIPPDPPQPTPGVDMIDFSRAVITRESPDVRGWPITTAITGYWIPPANAGDGSHSDIRFSKRGFGGWPFLEGPEGGPIQYTLWVGCLIAGRWHFSGNILCISQHADDNYCPTGPTLRLGQLPDNWYYYAGSPLADYQPIPGEMVAWLVTAGVQRRRDDHVVAERSNVILAPFTEGWH